MIPEWSIFVSVCLFLLSFVCFCFCFRHEQNWHDLIILALVARSYALLACIASVAGSLKVSVVLSNLLL